jgi:predicted nuclease of predicted toxin-antitoxin system
VTRLLLADENFPLPVIEGLGAAGFDVLSVARHCPGIDDRGVLSLARESKRWLLTFDSDFGDLIFFHGVEPPPAILYFRLHLVRLEDLLSIALRGLAEVSDGMFAVVTARDTRLRALAPTSANG